MRSLFEIFLYSIESVLFVLPCPTNVANTYCGTLLAPNAPTESMVVLCKRCDAQVCFGCGGTSARLSELYLPRAGAHTSNCRVLSGKRRELSELDLEMAQLRALLIVEAESEWMLEALSYLRQSMYLHKDLWEMVGRYLPPPGAWSLVLRG